MSKNIKETYFNKANYLMEDLDDFESISDLPKPKKGPLGREDLAYNPKVDEVGTFWVVTIPTKESTLEDICFSVDLGSIALQFLGGLKISDIMAIFKKENQAKSFAQEELNHLKSFKDI